MNRQLVADYMRYAYTMPKGRAGNAMQGALMRVELTRTKTRWQRSDRPVLIHTMGKVGSMALADAVHRASIPGVEVFHTHRLVSHRDPGVRKERSGIAPRRTWFVSSALERCIGDTARPAVVLTVVRDPLERNVSGFFQTIERYLPDGRPISPGETPSVEMLVERFLEHYPHEAISTWLDREITAHFGVDPYAGSFDVDRGHEVHRHGNWTVGIARHDRFPAAAESMLGEALGVDGMQLTRRNATSDKHIAGVVDEFKRALVVPDGLLDLLYTSRYATHFGFERP